MRVLVVAAPLLGHVLPLVPLAEGGLRSAAAEVRAEIAAMPDPTDVAAIVAGVLR